MRNPVLLIVLASLSLAPLYSVGSAADPPGSSNPGLIAVAMLPFEVIEDGSAKLAESISEELVTLLRKDPRFIIVSEEGSSPPGQSNSSSRRTASALPAQFLIAGKVYAGGGREFVTLEIRDGKTGDVLWFENYDYSGFASGTLASYVFENLSKIADARTETDAG